MTATATRPHDESTVDLRTSPGRRRRDSVARWFFRVAAVTTLAVTALIIVTLAYDAEEFIRQLHAAEDGLGALTSIGWFPRRGLYDISTLLVGTFIVTGIAMLVAVPLGLGAAIYLAEYARPRIRKMLKPVIEVLAGIPSVVLGYFAISFITPTSSSSALQRRQQGVHARSPPASASAS